MNSALTVIKKQLCSEKVLQIMHQREQDLSLSLFLNKSYFWKCGKPVHNQSNSASLFHHTSPRMKSICDSSTPTMLYPTLQCAASSPWTQHTKKRGWWKDEDRGEDSIVFSPLLPLWVLCHLVMRLSASCCHSAFLSPLRFLPTANAPLILYQSLSTQRSPPFSSIHPLSNPRCHFIFFPHILLLHLGHLLPVF